MAGPQGGRSRRRAALPALSFVPFLIVPGCGAWRLSVLARLAGTGTVTFDLGEPGGGGVVRRTQTRFTSSPSTWLGWALAIIIIINTRILLLKFILMFALIGGGWGTWR